MKKAGRILSLVVILVMLTTAICFAAPETGEAGGLNLISTYPEDGSKGAATENMGIKLYFDTQLSEEVLGEKNKDAIQIFGPEGDKLPTRVLYAPKEEGVVLVIVDTDKDGKTIKGESNAEYTVKISGNLTADNGATLGQNKEIKFRTMNEATNNTVSMVLMFVMMGGIMFYSTKAMKKEMEKTMEVFKDAPVNPYKEAKKTGKSVEEIVEQDKRNRERQEAKAARKASKAAAGNSEYQEYFDEYYEEYLAMYEAEGKHKVKGPRPIAAAGSKYITGRKAEAEARKAAEAEKKAQQAKWAANAKKGKGKKKK
ncbi:MAG: hypothetical protein IJB73_00280 [Firmicutes bacterium]|nr:hypothetical protein [Bacillota bacterium]